MCWLKPDYKSLKLFLFSNVLKSVAVLKSMVKIIKGNKVADHLKTHLKKLIKIEYFNRLFLLPAFIHHYSESKNFIII